VNDEGKEEDENEKKNHKQPTIFWTNVSDDFFSDFFFLLKSKN